VALVAGAGAGSFAAAVVTTLAGSATPGSANGLGTQAQFSGALGGAAEPLPPFPLHAFASSAPYPSPSDVPAFHALARRLVLSALADGGDQLRSLGAGPLTTAALLLMHERLGVMTALLTGFGRAIAEVGAVMIVGGNIDGFTRVMTTTIALETSKGDLPLALALGLVLLAVVGAINALIGLVQWRGAAGSSNGREAPL
jgi:hypothetical protein